MVSPLNTCTLNLDRGASCSQPFPDIKDKTRGQIVPVKHHWNKHFTRGGGSSAAQGPSSDRINSNARIFKCTFLKWCDKRGDETRLFQLTPRSCINKSIQKGPQTPLQYLTPSLGIWVYLWHLSLPCLEFVDTVAAFRSSSYKVQVFIFVTLNSLRFTPTDLSSCHTPESYSLNFPGKDRIYSIKKEGKRRRRKGKGNMNRKKILCG